MSMQKIKEAQAALHQMIHAEAMAHVRKLQSLNCHVKVVYEGVTIIDTLDSAKPLDTGRRREPETRQRAFAHRRPPGHPRRDIDGATGYRAVLDALGVGDEAVIKVPKGLDVRNVLSPVYGGCNRRFGAGNYVIQHDDKSITVMRVA